MEKILIEKNFLPTYYPDNFNLELFTDELTGILKEETRNFLKGKKIDEPVKIDFNLTINPKMEEGKEYLDFYVVSTIPPNQEVETQLPDELKRAENKFLKSVWEDKNFYLPTSTNTLDPNEPFSLGEAFSLKEFDEAGGATSMAKKLEQLRVSQQEKQFKPG